MRGYAVLTAFAVLLLCSGPRAADEDRHADYDEFLRRYVRGGLVAYGAIKEHPALLESYLRELATTDPEEFETTGGDEQMAFWINAYNAITIYGVIKNYPIQPGGFFARRRFPQNSIRQIDDFWDTVFIRVMGREVTLDDIEHDILRKQFGDPRIHFSIVCASMGCPVLSGAAYRGDMLENQLENDAWRFVNNEEKVRLDREKNKIFVSSIFKWYKEDFETGDDSDWLERYKKSARGFMAFIVRYIDEERRRYIVNNIPKIEYLDYDWSLNELLDEP